MNKNKYYVYCHYFINDNNERHVFYVGKGKDNRAYVTRGKGRDNGVWNKIVENLNGNYEIEIIKYFKDEKEAFKYEHELHEYYWNNNQCEANLDKSPQWRMKISNSLKGRKWSQESKNKRKQTLISKGIWKTDEEKKTIREKIDKNKPFRNKGENNGMYGKPASNRKQVIVVEEDGTKIEFDCCKDVDNYYNIKQSRTWARGTSNHYHSKARIHIYFKEIYDTIRDDKNEVSYN